mgnify:CR=1 FL=1
MKLLGDSVSKETHEAMDTILDCFACGDGGVQMVKVGQFVAFLDKESKNDDNYKQILQLVHRFARIIKYANKV